MEYERGIQSLLRHVEEMPSPDPRNGFCGFTSSRTEFVRSTTPEPTKTTGSQYLDKV
jgi:hypothetical protein